MSAPAVDYLTASEDQPLPKPALTPNSTAADAAGLVEVLRLITDPAVHKKHLDERQELAAAWRELRRERVELRRAAALQADELKRLRQEHNQALAIDKENHLSALRQREQKFAADLEEFNRILAGRPWRQEATDAFDPNRKLSPTEVHCYGADAKIHPVAGEVLEQGSGALPPDTQAALVHVLEIERREGKEAADLVREKLKMHIERRKK